MDNTITYCGVRSAGQHDLVNTYFSVENSDAYANTYWIRITLLYFCPNSVLIK